MKPGDTVTCAYRGKHRGTVLAQDDPLAWAGSLAFPSSSPDPDAVKRHVTKCREQNLLNDKQPVLWTTFPIPQVFWDCKLRKA